MNTQELVGQPVIIPSKGASSTAFPVKPGLPQPPQCSTSKARAPTAPPPVQYQQSQGSHSPPPSSAVPAKPGFQQPPQCSTSEARAPTAPQCSTSKARAPTAPQCITSKARAPTAPSAVPVKPGLP